MIKLVKVGPDQFFVIVEFASEAVNKDMASKLLQAEGIEDSEIEQAFVWTQKMNQAVVDFGVNKTAIAATAVA